MGIVYPHECGVLRADSGIPEFYPSANFVPGVGLNSEFVYSLDPLLNCTSIRVKLLSDHTDRFRENSNYESLVPVCFDLDFGVVTPRILDLNILGGLLFDGTRLVVCSFSSESGYSGIICTIFGSLLRN